MAHYDCSRCDQRLDKCECKPLGGVATKFKWGIHDDYSIGQLADGCTFALGFEQMQRVVKRGLFDTKEQAAIACEKLLRREIAALEDELAGKRMSLDRAGIGAKGEPEAKVQMTGKDLLKMVSDEDC